MTARIGVKCSVVVLSMFLGCQMARGQSPDIIAFQGNGDLTWTNGNTNLYYQIQWAPSLMGADVWRSNYLALADIVSTNPTITSPVPMFYRVVGSSNRTSFAAQVPQTRVIVDSAGDDGTFHKGVPWPSPRFTVGTGASSNCVLDNLTGLTWLRNPDATLRGWWTALNYCTNLNGTAGRGGYGDWRLPNVQELQSLVDYRYVVPCLPDTAGSGQCTAGNPFLGVQTARSYWSSTTYKNDANFTWGFEMAGGASTFLNKFDGTGFYTWPVRGGQ